LNRDPLIIAHCGLIVPTRRRGRVGRI